VAAVLRPYGPFRDVDHGVPDGESRSDGETMRGGHGDHGAYWAVASFFWILPGAVLLVCYLFLPDHNANGQCSGIGFGCTLTPKDTAAFLALFAYPVVFAVGAVFMFIVAAVRAYRRR
jgi:hypothetical protein